MKTIENYLGFAFTIYNGKKRKIEQKKMSMDKFEFPPNGLLEFVLYG